MMILLLKKNITESTLRDILIRVFKGIKPQVIPEISMELVNDKSIIKVSIKGNANVYSAFDKY